ncbi:MAG: class II glutamine amidotransferase [Polyangiales bacterium]
MGLLFTCMISRPDLLGEALREEREALEVTLPKAADGWGAGFYQAGEALHRKLPQPLEGQIAWSGVLEGVRSHVVIAHVREATVGDRKADNTQPFRMRQWLFAHVGEIAGHAAMRDRMLASLPDFLQRNIRGQTDSEVLFHVVLSFLHDGGHLDAVDVSDAAVVGALRGAVTLCDSYTREVGAAPGSLTMALTNGRQLYVMRRGSPLCMAQRDRLPANEGATPSDKHAPPQAVRYVIVASYQGKTVPTDFREVAEGEVVCIDRDLRVNRQSL